MTLKRVIARNEKMYEDTLPKWIEILIKDSYAEGKKEGKAQENRRLHRMHREWQKILDKTGV